MAEYPGGKGGSGVYQKIISLMPKHRVYIEAFLGSGAILRHKKPAEFNHGIEIDEKVIAEYWNEPLPKNFKIQELDVFDILKLPMNFDVDSPKDVLIYLDPPYLKSVRSSQRQIYRHELMTDAEHTELLLKLNCLPFNVMISGYDSELYNQMLSTWRKVSFTGVSRGGRKTEVVWMNFSEPDELHDYQFIGDNHRQRTDFKRKKARWINRLAQMTPQQKYAMFAAMEELKDRATAKTPRDPE